MLKTSVDYIKEAIKANEEFNPEKAYALSKSLVECGFKIEDYQISDFYRGCMEVIARKWK